MPHKTRTVLSSIIFTVLMFLTLSPSVYASDPSSAEQDENFLSQLRRENNFDRKIVLSIGPYLGLRQVILDSKIIVYIDEHYVESPAYLITTSDIYYLCIDYSFYEKLTEEERRYVIVHEFYHALNPYLERSIETEKSADELALSYGVDPKTIISFLDKYCSQWVGEYVWRVENMQRFVRSK